MESAGEKQESIDPNHRQRSMNTICSQQVQEPDVKVVSNTSDKYPTSGFGEVSNEQTVKKTAVSKPSGGLLAQALPLVFEFPKLSVFAYAAIGGRISDEKVREHIVASGCVPPPWLMKTKSETGRGPSDSLPGPSVLLTGPSAKLPGTPAKLPGTPAMLPGRSIPLGRGIVSSAGIAAVLGRRIDTLRWPSISRPSVPFAKPPVPLARRLVSSAMPYEPSGRPLFLGARRLMSSAECYGVFTGESSYPLPAEPTYRLAGPGICHQGFIQGFDLPTWTTGLKPRAITKNGGQVNDEMYIYPSMQYHPQQRCYDNTSRTSERFATETVMARPLTAITTRLGTMCLLLKGCIRVDMTVDQSIRVINFRNNIMLAMSSCGTSVGMVHPNGRIWQDRDDLEAAVIDHCGYDNNKYAKFMNKGISFMNDFSAVTFFLDSSGPRTVKNWDTRPLFKDFTVNLFYDGSFHGPEFQATAAAIIQGSQYWRTSDGEYNWCINGTRISQTKRGLVKVSRYGNEYCLETSSRSYRASISTPLVHMTATMKSDSNHMFTRLGNRRMHYDGNTFIVRVAGVSAGFDEHNQLAVKR